MQRFYSCLAFLPALFAAACANTDGGPVQGSKSYFVMPVDARDPINPGLPPSENDFGPKPLSDAECADPAGYDIALVDDFETGLASKSYTYNDSTGAVLPYSLKEWEPASTSIPTAWGGKRCNSTKALHLAGQYRQWGAGFGTVLYNHESTLTPAGVKIYPADEFAKLITFFPGDSPYIAGLTAADLASGKWEGITFWARRGPFAGPGIRPGLLDRTTADDFNKQLPPEGKVPEAPRHAACKSIYTVCSCQNTKHCTPWKLTDAPAGVASELMPDRDGTYCWDPATEAYPNPDPTLRCEQTACDYRIDTPIPTMVYNPNNAVSALKYQSNTITCSAQPYVFKDSGQPSAKYCYTPGVDEDPAEKEDRCQDGFLSGVLLDTNWRRYMVPFADLRQGTVSHRSPGIDLSVVEALVFSFPAGNLDVWIDDTGFYRKHQATP